MNVNFDIPEWLRHLIINDDRDHLTDDEIELGVHFMESAKAQFGPGYWTVADEMESEFAYNDVDTYLGETWVATYHYENK